MKYISKIFRIIISSLLALLGFSCSKGYWGDTAVAEYGAPSATYIAKGIVVSEEEAPIEGVQARFFMDSSYRTYTLDTTYTNSSGFFSLMGHESPKQILYVELLYLDGELTGTFTKMILKADYTNATFTGSSGSWYEGYAEIDLGIIKMKTE